jgi:hypothetical protein
MAPFLMLSFVHLGIINSKTRSLARRSQAWGDNTSVSEIERNSFPYLEK